MPEHNKHNPVLNFIVSSPANKGLSVCRSNSIRVMTRPATAITKMLAALLIKVKGVFKCSCLVFKDQGLWLLSSRTTMTIYKCNYLISEKQLKRRWKKCSIGSFVVSTVDDFVSDLYYKITILFSDLIFQAIRCVLHQL